MFCALAAAGVQYLGASTALAAQTTASDAAQPSPSPAPSSAPAGKRKSSASARQRTDFTPQIEVVPYFVTASGSDNIPKPGDPQIDDVWMDYSLIQPLPDHFAITAKQYYQFDTVGRTYLTNGKTFEPGSARQAVDQFLLGYQANSFVEIHAGYFRKWTICCPADGAPGNRNTTDYSGPDYGVTLTDHIGKRIHLAYTFDDIWVKHLIYPRQFFGGLSGEGNKWVVRHGLFSTYSLDPANVLALEAGIGQQGDYYQDYPTPGYGLSITYGASYRLNRRMRLEFLALHRNGHDDGLYPMHQRYEFSDFFIKLHINVLGKPR
jgi:hypothetical protein